MNFSGNDHNSTLRLRQIAGANVALLASIEEAEVLDKKLMETIESQRKKHDLINQQQTNIMRLLQQTVDSIETARNSQASV